MNRADRRRAKGKKVTITTSVEEMTAGTFHFVPGDRPKHLMSMQCWCKPTCEIIEVGATIIKHNLPPTRTNDG